MGKSQGLKVNAYVSDRDYDDRSLYLSGELVTVDSASKSRRAQELIGVGQSQAALSLLHEHVTSKRTRNNPIASIEPVMLLFVELCVNLRKGKSAKDGLYSYKNTAQNTNVGTIEMVLKKFIALAETKVTEAQEKAEEVQSTIETGAPTTSIDDLEATETPESILLSTVSGEQSRDRTDRAIVTPWLKFLWETYRTVLDILKNNARLEILYQSTAHQAFQFCLKYTRKTEFRRLCELLRNHLQNAAKYQSQIHAINLSDPDTLQRHLDTRFQQLNVAVELELWQEAFRSIEDIHTLLNLSKRPAKPIMMANYFEKLSTIFLVSENYLFHAAALNRYLNLLRSTSAAVAAGQSQKKDNPTVTEADLSSTASFVILSALAIPVISTSRSRGALLDVDEARKNKHQRLTNLLGLSAAPTRASLFKDILSKGLLKRARPEIRDLYNILEVDFHPLSICKKISPILARIGADPEMGKYVLPLQQVILTRLFQQLSQVYESVDLKFVLGLAQFPEPFQVSSGTIEKFIMNGCKKGDLAIRIDHATGALTFDSDVFSAAKALHPGSGAGSAESESGSVQRLQNTPAEIVRSQLTRLAKTLYVTCQYVSESFVEDQNKARALALQRAEAGGEKEHSDTLERRAIIERKKQAAATAAAQKQKEEETQRMIRAQKQSEAEKERQAALERKRDEARMQTERTRLRREEARKQLQEIGDKIDIDMSEIDLDEIDSGRIRAMKLAALEREKNEIGERLRVTGKRNDHLERAFRREEMKHLPGDYDAQRQRDQTEYDQTTADTLRDAEQKHKEDVALKNRLSRLVPQYEGFRERVRTERHAQFEKQRRAAEQELQQKKDARIREVRERKIREQKEREAQEQAERDEEERLQREAEEKAAADEERRQRLAEEKVRREEERKRLDEQAEKQRQKEAEAEAKLAAKRAGGSGRGIPERPSASPSTGMERSDSSGPPRVGLGKPSGGWRDRLAAKEAGNASSPPPTQAAIAPPTEGTTPPPATGGRFVPPALRNKTADTAPPRPESAGDGWRSASGPSRGRDENMGSSKYPPSRVTREDTMDRTASPANGAPATETERSFSGVREAPSAELPQSGAPGKYRPGAFKNRGAQ